MDIKWTIDEAMCAYRNGGCKDGAANAILNALALSEMDTIAQYQYANVAFAELYKDEPEKAKVFNKLVNEVVQDEGDHNASFNKAAAIVAGYEPAKPDEYNKAVKANDGKAV